MVEGRGGKSIYDHWSEGYEDAPRHDDARVPEPVLLGYIQGGLNASVTEQFGQQGYHIAYVISEALKRGITAVEPSQEAQDDYVRQFEELEIDLSEFQRQCPPSYFNNEGEAKPKWALFRGYGPGWDAFQKLLQTGATRATWRGSLK